VDRWLGLHATELVQRIERAMGAARRPGDPTHLLG
jgi:hypothetical protein